MSYPWICPRCQTSNGPGAMTCQNPQCKPLNVYSTTLTGGINAGQCPYCRKQLPCGETHVIC